MPVCMPRGVCIDMISNLKKPGLTTVSLLLLFCIALLISCRQGGSGSQKPGDPHASNLAPPIALDLDKILERGSLRAIIDNSSTGYFIYKGQPMGFEYDLLNRFAKKLDVELEIILTSSIEEAFAKLNSGEGDICAYNLTITKERNERFAFSNTLMEVRQVLVQRKPEGWRRMHPKTIDRMLIRNPIDLIGKQVYVRNNSSHKDRMENLSHEIGGDILIVEGFKNEDTEALIKKVLDGEIDYAIADENVALVNATYYPELDVKTAISFPQRIAWAIRKNAPQLLDVTNEYVGEIKASPFYNTTYKRYFTSTKTILTHANSEYSTISSDRISEYDSLIRNAAKEIDWDWRLLAALIYQESRFNPKANSWAGAVGLMQVVPRTGRSFGVTRLNDPAENLKAGTSYLLWLDELFKEKVPDSLERQKFVLASYNVGQGHVLDAMRLAEKYGAERQVWSENVETYLLNKSQAAYYNDPVVQFGYCRGYEPVQYVRKIMARFEQYQLKFKADVEPDLIQ